MHTAVCAAACSKCPLACAGPHDMARCCYRCCFQHPSCPSPCVVWQVRPVLHPHPLSLRSGPGPDRLLPAQPRGALLSSGVCTHWLGSYPGSRRLPACMCDSTVLTCGPQSHAKLFLTDAPFAAPPFAHPINLLTLLPNCILPRRPAGTSCSSACAARWASSSSLPPSSALAPSSTPWSPPPASSSISCCQVGAQTKQKATTKHGCLPHLQTCPLCTTRKLPAVGWADELKLPCTYAPGVLIDACMYAMLFHRTSCPASWLATHPTAHPPCSLAVMWNANPLLPQQWAAVALVFGGLLVSSWTKSRRARHSKHAADPKAQ